MSQAPLSLWPLVLPEGGGSKHDLPFRLGFDSGAACDIDTKNFRAMVP